MGAGGEGLGREGRLTPRLDTLRLHRWASLAPGPRLIVTGAVHGNETAGTRAIERLAGELDRGELALVRGTLSLVPVCNPLAYANGRREGDRNLNRRLRPTAAPVDNEDRIANVLCGWLAEHDVLLDLHSFRSGDEPFVLRGPPDNDGAIEPFGQAALEARLAAHLGPRRVVDGWLATVAAGAGRRLARGVTRDDVAHGIGTTEHMRAVGGAALTLECGRHDDPQAPDVGHRAVRQALAVLGMTDAPPEPPCADPECLTLVEVVDRADPADAFARDWRSFDRVAAGTVIGTRADGRELLAPFDGCIVFPDPGALPGREWYFLARPGTRPL